MKRPWVLVTIPTLQLALAPTHMTEKLTIHAHPTRHYQPEDKLYSGHDPFGREFFVLYADGRFYFRHDPATDMKKALRIVEKAIRAIQRGDV